MARSGIEVVPPGRGVGGTYRVGPWPGMSSPSIPPVCGVPFGHGTRVRPPGGRPVVRGLDRNPTVICDRPGRRGGVYRVRPKRRSAESSPPPGPLAPAVYADRSVGGNGSRGGARSLRQRLVSLGLPPGPTRPAQAAPVGRGGVDPAARPPRPLPPPAGDARRGRPRLQLPDPGRRGRVPEGDLVELALPGERPAQALPGHAQRRHHVVPGSRWASRYASLSACDQFRSGATHTRPSLFCTGSTYPIRRRLSCRRMPVTSRIRSDRFVLWSRPNCRRHRSLSRL